MLYQFGKKSKTNTTLLLLQIGFVMLLTSSPLSLLSKPLNEFESLLLFTFVPPPSPKRCPSEMLRSPRLAVTPAPPSPLMPCCFLLSERDSLLREGGMPEASARQAAKSAVAKACRSGTMPGCEVVQGDQRFTAAYGTANTARIRDLLHPALLFTPSSKLPAVASQKAL